MRWRKLGLVYCPDGSQWWARSYAHLPTADVLGDGRIRVYFAGLDEHRYGRIGYVDVDAADPLRVLEIGQEPVLDLGELGTFDDCGVNPSCVLDVEGRKYLYYIGWQRCERVPYMLFAGLAVSDDNGATFQRVQPVPVLDRTPVEPFLRSATTVLREGDTFRVWYVSGLRWIVINGVQYPSYVIRHATSADGLHWTSSPHICIDFKDADEFGFGRPWVIRDGNLYRMWYAIRSRSAPYRIGYAESSDGIVWTRRDDQAGIAASTDGWDAEMVCYPNVVTVNGAHLMFYNGNGHGKSGFGCALLET